MATRAIIFQCAACRSLVTAASAVRDDGSRAGLACDVCGAVTWLPFGAAGERAGAHVVDVEPPGAAASRQLATSAVGAPSTALVPTAASAVSVAGGASFNDDQRGRIAERLRALPAAGTAQEELSTSFERLLGHWGNDVEHKNLLKKASMIGELAFVGQRYRAVLEIAPGDAHAKQAQNDLLGLAMASMSRDKDMSSSGSGGINKNVLAGIVLAVTVALCAAIVTFMPRFLQPGATDEIIDVAPLEGAVPSADGRP